MSSPLNVITQLVAAMNAQELEPAVALFEPGASFVMKPGVVVSGTAGIRQALEGFMAMKPTLTLEAQQVTTLHFVPSMLQAFVEHLGSEPGAARRCGSVRRLICSGEALSAELRDHVLRLLPHVQLENLYGPTEASIDVTRWACTGDTSREVPITV